MEHVHSFDEADWPFDVSASTPAYSTTNVVQNGFPILTIAHDHEGDWQFLCETPLEQSEISVVCLGCVFEHHPYVGEFHNLPVGWIAWRNNEEDPWHREEMEPESE